MSVKLMRDCLKCETEPLAKCGIGVAGCTMSMYGCGGGRGERERRARNAEREISVRGAARHPGQLPMA